MTNDRIIKNIRNQLQHESRDRQIARRIHLTGFICLGLIAAILVIGTVLSWRPVTPEAQTLYGNKDRSELNGLIAKTNKR